MTIGILLSLWAGAAFFFGCWLGRKIAAAHPGEEPPAADVIPLAAYRFRGRRGQIVDWRA
jgi:hypothetical protein